MTQTTCAKDIVRYNELESKMETLHNCMHNHYGASKICKECLKKISSIQYEYWTLINKLEGK